MRDGRYSRAVDRVVDEVKGLVEALVEVLVDLRLPQATKAAGDGTAAPQSRVLCSRSPVIQALCAAKTSSCCRIDVLVFVLYQERDVHLAPLVTVLAGRPPRTRCGIRLCVLERSRGASFPSASRTEQGRFRPFFEI